MKSRKIFPIGTRSEKAKWLTIGPSALKAAETELRNQKEDLVKLRIDLVNQCGLEQIQKNKIAELSAELNNLKELLTENNIEYVDTDKIEQVRCDSAYPGLSENIDGNPASDGKLRDEVRRDRNDS